MGQQKFSGAPARGGALLPEPLVQAALAGAASTPEGFRPRYLNASDHPWLEALLRAYRHFEGKRRAELDAHLKQPLAAHVPADRVRRARHVLDRLCTPLGSPPREAARLREAIFLAAAGRESKPADVISTVAAANGHDRGKLVDAAFSDLPSERRLPALPGDLDVTELALRTNQALVQGLCARSEQLTIDLWGNARAIVRLAHLRGLLCTVRPMHADVTSGMPSVRLELSGPLSIFRRTRLYGRALASLMPHLCWCERFEVRMDIRANDRTSPVFVSSGAPVFPAKPPKPFDSKLEERFARDFVRLTDDWALQREPAPIAANGALIFPDFAIQHRRDPTLTTLLEIAGFWTTDYLREKLRHLRAAGIPDLILCVDARRACGSDDFPSEARVVLYRRRIDANAVLQLLEH